MSVLTDILRLSGVVSPVLGLSLAFKLAMLIIQTIQISKSNTARLRALAHLVAESHVSVAENMQSRWDEASPALKTKVNEFEIILEGFLRLMKQYTSSSPMMSLLIGGQPDFDITMLEKRLSDARSSILLLLCVDASVASQYIRQSVNPQESIANATVSAAVHLGDLNHQRNSTMSGARDDPNICIYTRKNILVLEIIKEYLISLFPDQAPPATTVTVKLQKATFDSKVMVLVKSYHGIPSRRKTDLFQRDLTFRKQILDPSVLQVFGASRATASIPFQIYHIPDGHFEPLSSWLKRTLPSDPVEAIYGLYDMRTSALALEEFQRSQFFSLPSSSFSLREGLCVTVQPGHNRHQWKLIYAGELSNNEGEFSRYHIYHAMRVSLPWDEDTGRDPATLMGYMLCWSLARMHSPGDDLVDILGCRYEDITLPMLGAAFFKQGWLEPSQVEIHPTDTVALGDIGSVKEAGDFVVIDNIHQHMQAESGTLSWNRCQWFKSGKYLEDTFTEVIESWSGKAYQRRRLHPLTIPAHMYMWINLRYENLNQMHAWKVLQRDAHSIITCHGLSIAPHELRLVISIERWWNTDLTVVDGLTDLGDECTFEWDSGTDAERMDPTVYVFSNNDAPDIRNSGPPELTSLRSSFDPEPKWLADGTWYDWEEQSSEEDTSTSEVKDGLCLDSSEIYPSISYLQLPIGAARPFISEVEEPLCTVGKEGT